jgi:CRP-like cAMP-binding protein
LVEWSFYTALQKHAGQTRDELLSRTGKEAVVAMLGPGDFFGEGALAGQSIRIGTATATMPTTVLVIEKGAMVRLLHRSIPSRTASSRTCWRGTSASKQTSSTTS